MLDSMMMLEVKMLFTLFHNVGLVESVSDSKSLKIKKEADFAYRIQSILAYKDLAPKVYGQVGRIQKSGYDGELTGYGYLTEIARPMAYCDDEYCDGECFESECSNGTIISEVVYDLHEQGLTYADAHRGNFGFVRREGYWIPVVIDVGIESFSDWDEDIYGRFEYDGDDCDCDCCDCVKARGAI